MDRIYPKFVVGAFIVNNNGELFLWRNDRGYVCPNFKVLKNKTIESTLRDGIKEKLGLDMIAHEFVDLVEGLDIPIDSEGNTTHLIFADYKITVSNENEFSPPAEYRDREHHWFTPDKWLSHDESEFGPYITTTVRRLM